MGKLNDLKQQMYGHFMKWMEIKKMGDPFSNDVWANKSFDRLFAQFEEEVKNNRFFENFMNNVPDDILDNILKLRKEHKEKNKAAGKITQMPKKKIIVPGSKS